MDPHQVDCEHLSHTDSDSQSVNKENCSAMSGSNSPHKTAKLPSTLTPVLVSSPHCTANGTSPPLVPAPPPTGVNPAHHPVPQCILLDSQPINALTSPNSGCKTSCVASASFPPKSIQCKDAAATALVMTELAVNSEGHRKRNTILVDGRQSVLVIEGGDGDLSKESKEDGHMKLLHGQEQTLTSLLLTRVSNGGRDTNYACIVARMPTTCYSGQSECFEVLSNPSPAVSQVVTTPLPTLSDALNVAVQQDGLGMQVGLVGPEDEPGQFDVLPLPNTNAQALPSLAEGDSSTECTMDHFVQHFNGSYGPEVD